MSDTLGTGPNRRTFLQTTAATAAAAYVVATERPAPARAADYFPSFSWDRVPVAADIGKVTANFSQSEVNFLANHFSYLSIEKAQATGLQPKGSEQTEIGFETADRALKAANPAVKVLYYWSGAAFHANYASAKNFDQSWAHSNVPGGALQVYDLTNPAFRNWWINSAATIVDQPGVDGLFIDSFNNINVNQNKRAMLQGFRQHVEGQGKSPIIIFNGIPRSSSDPASYLDLADGIFYEHFDSYESTSPDKVLKDLLAMQQVAKSGKILHFRGWPGFTLSDPIVRTTEYADLVSMARKAITFPLACFLAIAEQYSYFQYSWGYSNLGGSYILQADKETVDPAWYAELLKPLGAPKGDASRNGYAFTRSFEHADISVDIAAHSANINWH